MRDLRAEWAGLCNKIEDGRGSFTGVVVCFPAAGGIELVPVMKKTSGGMEESGYHPLGNDALPLVLRLVFLSNMSFPSLFDLERGAENLLVSGCVAAQQEFSQVRTRFMEGFGEGGYLPKELLEGYFLPEGRVSLEELMSRGTRLGLFKRSLSDALV